MDDENYTLNTCYELFGIECRDGWRKLYQPIIDKVIEYNETHKDYPIAINQIKEKYGGLRVYLSYYTKELSDMIDRAEEESYHICEVCGKHIDEPIEENHWIYAECEECHNEITKQKEKNKKK